MIPNLHNEKDIEIVTDEIVNVKDFEKSDIKRETYGSIDELNYPQDYNDGGIIILDNKNDKEKTDPRVQAMFKGSRHET